MRAVLLFHVYSGQLFFSAIALFIAGVAGGRRTRILPLLAIAFAALSGTPMSLWIGVPLVLIATAAALMNDNWRRGRRAWLKIVAIAAVLGAGAMELRWHLPETNIRVPKRLIVIGDSLSAPGFGDSPPWPERLGVPVENLSRASDTVTAAATDQLPLIPAPQSGDAVVIEIGGNDMMERRSVAEFEKALHEIIAACAPRTVVLVELPIVPGAWAYGAAQRRVASKHRATLIPKRVLARVLVDPRNTDDGLHLTNRGHEELARTLAATMGWSRK